MTVYHVIQGVPDKFGNIKKYAIIFSYADRDRAYDHLEHLTNCNDIVKNDDDDYVHAPSGEHFRVMMSFVLE